MANHELTRAFTGGPIFEFIDPMYHGMWYNNTESASTFMYLMDLLPLCNGNKFGVDEDGRGILISGYKDPSPSSAELGGDRVDWNITENGGWVKVESYQSNGHNGIEFTRGQINQMGPKAGSRVDIIEQEKNEKLADLLALDNARVLGVNGHGTGARVPARGSYDTWGLRTILNNNNLFYNRVRPPSGVLNSINDVGRTINANQLTATIGLWQQMVRNNGQQVPTLIILSTNLMEWVQSEGINIWGNVDRAVQFNIQKAGHYEYDGPKLSTWGNDLKWCFDSSMPGSGPGANDNEILLVNPNYIDFVWEEGLFYNEPEFHQGDKTRPNEAWSYIDSNINMMVRCPQAHVRATGVIIP